MPTVPFNRGRSNAFVTKLLPILLRRMGIHSCKAIQCSLILLVVAKRYPETPGVGWFAIIVFINPLAATFGPVLPTNELRCGRGRPACLESNCIGPSLHAGERIRTLTSFRSSAPRADVYAVSPLPHNWCRTAVRSCTRKSSSYQGIKPVVLLRRYNSLRSIFTCSLRPKERTP